MTRITYRKKDGFKIIFEGHSGYGSAGNDIVCAAISTLSQTLLNYMIENHLPIRFDIQSGYLCMESKSVDYVPFDVMMCGLKMIASEYPLYVSIEEGGALL